METHERIRSAGRRAPTALFLIGAIGLAGCGQALTPAQQAEYDQLRTQRATAKARLQESMRARERAFHRASEAEYDYGAHTNKVVVCGKNRNRTRRFGPLPFSRKAGYRVVIDADKEGRFGGSKCTIHRLRVKR